MTRKWNRRDFVRAGILGGGATVAAGATDAATKPPEPAIAPNAVARPEGRPKVNYRTLGRTQLKVSEIAFGTFGFSGSDIFNAALDAGINFVQTCADYQDGRAEEAIGKVLAKRRKDAIVATGWTLRPDWSKAKILELLDESLKRLQTDRIEIMLAHMTGTLEQIQNPALYDAFDEAKKAKKARFLAVSSHGPKDIDKILEFAIDKGAFDAMFMKYNFMEFPAADKAIELAGKKNLGLAVFKVEAGARAKELDNYESKGLTHEQAAARWALQNKSVASVIRLFKTFEDVKGALATMARPFGPQEAAMLDRYKAAFWNEYCRYCGQCDGLCPHGVAVSEVMRYAMYFKYYGRERHSMELYAALDPQVRANPCEQCAGQCRQGCPFGVRVREQLVEAHRSLTFTA
jgi:hypothetical protein